MATNSAMTTTFVCLVLLTANAHAFTVELVRGRNGAGLSSQSMTDSEAGHEEWDRHQVSPRAMSMLSGKGSTKARGQIIQTQVRPYINIHLMKMTFGTPPVDIYVAADTGSDLVWTQCVPCPCCYKQNRPLFDPSKSSTYKGISCDDPRCCELVINPACTENQCEYHNGYDDKDVAQGFLATEKVGGFGITSVDMVIGCGHNNTGLYNDHMMGIAGLGGGPLSLTSQLAEIAGGKKLSQCLIPFESDPQLAGKLTFGSRAVVSGPGTVTFPLQAPYAATMLGITVGEVFVPFNSPDKKLLRPNMYLDLGSPVTYLPDTTYTRIYEEVKKQVQQIYE